MTLTYQVSFSNLASEQARIQYGEVYKVWNTDKPSSVSNKGKAALLITGDSKKAEGKFVILYAEQTFEVTLSYISGSNPTFTHDKFDSVKSLNKYQLQVVNPPVILPDNSANVKFEVIAAAPAKQSYKCTFFNSTNEDARLTYRSIHLSWNTDKPSTVILGTNTVLTITGDEKSASGSFTIEYAGQKFTITLSYKQGSKPTFKSEKIPSHSSSPNRYVVKEDKPPFIVGSSQAQVSFQIIIDQKPARK